VSEGGTWGEQAEAAENQEASASSRYYLSVRYSSISRNSLGVMVAD